MTDVQEVNEAIRETSTERESKDGKYLTFRLADEEYGLEILKVREIMGLMEITKIPRTQDYIRGVINLRGKVIPVIDLRAKFGMETVEYTNETCIIVVETHGLHMGIVVDKVSEVLDIAARDIEDAPSFGDDVCTDYLLGIGKSEDQVKLLLDINKVLSSNDLIDLESVESTMSEEPEPATSDVS